LKLDAVFEDRVTLGTLTTLPAVIWLSSA